MRKEAHKLNRKGIHPTRLNQATKTADEFEDSEAKESDYSQKHKSEGDLM